MGTLRLGLTLVRHGETEYNKAGLLQGQGIDSALSETGQQQAAAAGFHLRDVGFSHVFSSDMLRARQTAEKIMQQNSSCAGLQMVCDPLLKEKSFGVAEGGRIEDLKEMARAAGASFPGFTPPEGETPEQVKQRFQRFLDNMLQRIGTELWPVGDVPSRDASPADDAWAGGLPAHALVVTHGAYMSVAARYLVEELRCGLPAGCDRQRMFSVSPNAGMCRFILSVSKEGSRFLLSGTRCVFMHRVADKQ